MGFFNKLQQPIFLKEDSDTQEYINLLQALLDKVTGTAKEKIENEIKLTTYGLIGENNIAFELKNSGIPMYILRDIYFEINGLSAQIDYLLITRKLIIVIESKNLIGDIEIDGAGNFIRKYNIFGKFVKEGIYSPITQNQRHLEVLKQARRETKNNILKRYMFDKFFDENYKSIVVLANPKTILNSKFAPKELKKQVIRSDQLNQHIKDLNSSSKLAELSDKDMVDISEKLLSMSLPNKRNYSKKYEEMLQSITNENKILESAIELSTTINRDELIKELKTFRLEQSRNEKIKPYYIFNDKQMISLIDEMPKTKEDLLKVSGFGPQKVDKYGTEILTILTQK